MTPFNTDLWCTPVGWSYLYERHEGLFFHEVNENCEMMACVATFAKLDPEVKVINTYAGNTPNAVYIKTDDGWKSFVPTRGAAPPVQQTPLVRH